MKATPTPNIKQGGKQQPECRKPVRPDRAIVRVYRRKAPSANCAYMVPEARAVSSELRARTRKAAVRWFGNWLLTLVLIFALKSDNLTGRVRWVAVLLIVQPDAGMVWKAVAS